jgi:hypothetical protein
VKPGHITNSPFQSGPLIRKKSELLDFAAFPENRSRLSALNKRLKLFRGEDGWFASGRQGQVWEWGRGKLGFTVGTTRMISIAQEAGFVPTQRGDQEANFSCDWNDETIERLIKLLRLRIRGVGNPSPRPMSEQLVGKIPGLSASTRSPQPMSSAPGVKSEQRSNASR